MLIIWNEDKNEWLKKEREVSFEQVKSIIENDEVIDIRENPTHKDRLIYIVLIKEYIHCVPFEFIGEDIFLFTIYPDRKLNMEYNK